MPCLKHLRPMRLRRLITLLRLQTLGPLVRHIRHHTLRLRVCTSQHSSTTDYYPTTTDSYPMGTPYYSSQPYYTSSSYYPLPKETYPPTTSPCSLNPPSKPDHGKPDNNNPGPNTPSPLRATYDTTFDNKAGSLHSVACSNGPNGLSSRFPTFGDISNFPFIGGAFDVAWNSPNCGGC